MAYPIVILGSGSGTNAEALLKAEANKQLGAAKIAAIISDHEDAGILELGQKYQVPAIYIDPKRKGARLSDEAEQTYIERIASFSPKLIVLAGFMRIINRPFIEAFEGRMINLHPSLLPSFPWHGWHCSSLRSRRKSSLVAPYIGSLQHSMPAPIIDQKEVRIEEQDTLELLEKKVHIVEHQLLPDVVARLSKGKIKSL